MECYSEFILQLDCSSFNMSLPLIFYLPFSVWVRVYLLSPRATDVFLKLAVERQMDISMSLAGADSKSLPCAL